MPILVMFIIVSFAFYLFYKLKAWKLRNRQHESRWVGTKAAVALGLVLVFFGLNALYVRQSAVTIVISVILIAVGSFYIYQNIRLYRHLLPYAVEEARQNELNGDQ
ncbi:MAG TPA: YtpI family protein [Bacillales bacterium]|nr:YtpI family protein [Bacillales bacterium]